MTRDRSSLVPIVIAGGAAAALAFLVLKSKTADALQPPPPPPQGGDDPSVTPYGAACHTAASGQKYCVSPGTYRGYTGWGVASGWTPFANTQLCHNSVCIAQPQGLVAVDVPFFPTSETDGVIFDKSTYITSIIGGVIRHGDVGHCTQANAWGHWNVVIRFYDIEGILVGSHNFDAPASTSVDTIQIPPVYLGVAAQFFTVNVYLWYWGGLAGYCTALGNHTVVQIQ
jgi:hypothetical protein